MHDLIVLPEDTGYVNWEALAERRLWAERFCNNCRYWELEGKCICKPEGYMAWYEQNVRIMGYCRWGKVHTVGAMPGAANRYSPAYTGRVTVYEVSGLSPETEEHHKCKAWEAVQPPHVS